MDNLTPPGHTDPPTGGRASDRSCWRVFHWLCRNGTRGQLVMSLMK